MKNLPKKVFVVWQDEDTVDEYLGVATDVSSLVYQGEKKRAALSPLIHTHFAPILARDSKSSP